MEKTMKCSCVNGHATPYTNKRGISTYKPLVSVSNTHHLSESEAISWMQDDQDPNGWVEGIHVTYAHEHVAVAYRESDKTLAMRIFEYEYEE